MQRFVCLLACLSIVLSSASAADIYVKADATGANNGSSWTDAYTSLSSAITASTTGDAIRVATGTYRPQYVSGFPSLKSGVSLTGGYYVTGGVGYLWGDYSDIDGDIGTQGVHTDDAGKLFELWQISNVSISGFAFRYTRGSNYGGMIHVLSGSNITISDCIFRDANMSDSCRGGAVSIYGSTGTTVSNCEFYDCHAGLGGAMNLDGNPSSPVTYTITGCSLHDNDTTSASTFETSRAGAVFLYSSNAAFTNCTFENNLSGNGGAVNISLGNASFSGCAFRYNQAGDSSTSSAGNRGGAVCVGSTVSSSSSVPEVSFADCDFKGNVAYGRGGAVFGTLKTTIERCWFRGNQSLFNATSSNVETLGGAVFIATEAIGNNVDSNTTSVTSNSVFVSNSAGKGGGAWAADMYLSGTIAKTKIVNCSFTSNSAADSYGAALYGSNSTLHNSIVWGNTSSSSPLVSVYPNTTTWTVSYSDVEGGFQGSSNFDPLFNSWPSYSDCRDAFLGSSSPAIDAGSNALVVGSYDFAGGSRILNSTVDMGAREISFSAIATGNSSTANPLSDAPIFPRNVLVYKASIIVDEYVGWAYLDDLGLVKDMLDYLNLFDDSFVPTNMAIEDGRLVALGTWDSLPVYLKCLSDDPTQSIEHVDWEIWNSEPSNNTVLGMSINPCGIPTFNISMFQWQNDCP